MNIEPLLIFGADFPIQWIIPAIFVVIWSLNQVFGREDKPAPPVRREPPLGPRPGTPQRAPRPLPRPEGTREPTMRWSERDRRPPSRAARSLRRSGSGWGVG